MDSPPDRSEELILRDRLAMDRTRLANERTLLAYLRTALMVAVTGATAIKVFGDDRALVATGWALVGVGVFVAVLGAWRFRTMRREIGRRPSP